MKTYLLVLGGLLALDAHAQRNPAWPLYTAPWSIRVENANESGVEGVDPRWIRLGPGETVTLRSFISTDYEERASLPSSFRLRYLVHGVPVSGWLAPSGTPPRFPFALSSTNSGLAGLASGIHDVSVEVQNNSGYDYREFKPNRGFLVLERGPGFPRSLEVPILNQDQETFENQAFYGPGVAYVDPLQRRWFGYPADSTVTPWTVPPDQADLFVEEMMPHTILFNPLQMWWEEPPVDGARGRAFVRGFEPKHDEDHRQLRVVHQHEKFPYRDGPRGHAWMSSYANGMVTSTGRYAFAEPGGRVGYLEPDGEIVTIAGWRVNPSRDPIWYEFPLATVRQNMQLRGVWQNGKYPGEDGGFRTPMDVTVDPNNENIWYVVGYEDNCVWKVDLGPTPRRGTATVSVFAGDPNHSPGFTNGAGHAARFSGPSSIAWDPVRDVMYVVDQDNDAIRRVDRNGNVTTVVGSPGMAGRLGSIDIYDKAACRGASRMTTTASQWTSGQRPDLYVPQTVRVDSAGNLVFSDTGYGTIRKLNPATGLCTILGTIDPPHREFYRGWSWLDVDRWGACGPRDGVYWCVAVTSLLNPQSGESGGGQFNEVYGWLPPAGGTSRMVIEGDTGLHPDGWGGRTWTNPPHYPWVVAVDRRGAILVGGMGEAGLCRIRLRKPTDPSRDADNYWLGRNVWYFGAPQDPEESGNGFALRYGLNGHNLLGYEDAWGLKGATDQQLANAFRCPTWVRDNPEAFAQWLAYIRPNTETGTGVVTTHDLSGRFTFSGLASGVPVPSSVTVEYRDPGTARLVSRHSVLLASNGDYVIMGGPIGQFDVTVKHGRWLRRTISVDTRRQQLTTGANFVLVNGDINGDNSVNATDFLMLRAAFGSSPGAGNWNANADLNGDGSVNLQDFLILRGSFGRSGDG